MSRKRYAEGGKLDPDAVARFGEASERALKQEALTRFGEAGERALKEKGYARGGRAKACDESPFSSAYVPPSRDKRR
jgi:hypothetical protein